MQRKRCVAQLRPGCSLSLRVLHNVDRAFYAWRGRIPWAGGAPPDGTPPDEYVHWADDLRLATGHQETCRRVANPCSLCCADALMLATARREICLQMPNLNFVYFLLNYCLPFYAKILFFFCCLINIRIFQKSFFSFYLYVL